MPRGDRTGPLGMGPMSGHGAGYCHGFDAPGCVNNEPGFAGRRGSGRGAARGFGRGMRRGYRNMFYATGMPGWVCRRFFPYAGAAPDEKTFLSNQAAFLERQLQQIKSRLSSLEEPAR